ncbi:MAG: L-glutamate gamma-semialdehyde dehydrogenase [Thermoanaerobaculia bacterium]|nr:L-glutamate gamma-semialdehyde dehydrogenase [Thermoanaerobaculia bacterium]
MSNAVLSVPPPKNEPVRSYAPGSPEKASLKATLAGMMAETIEIPLIIGGKEVRTGDVAEAVCPHDHGHVLAKFHQAGAANVEQAVAAAKEAWKDWSETPWEDRAAVFLKAAELLAGPWRDRVNAATMLNQSKTVYQAEIDSACELIDFWRFNTDFMRRIYAEQPISAPGIWNQVEYRALEGYVFAVTPFNFTSIAGNLPTSPALMGNVVLWKPASTSVFSGWQILRLLQEAGLPDGVINFLPGSGRKVGDPAIAHPDFAGIHFTGSTGVFQGMWKAIGGNIERYRSYPRIVGETGGKDFVFMHPSADVQQVATALVRGAFEYQGQKCSAASRAYVPKSLWPAVRDAMGEQLARLSMGSPLDFRNFMAAVIDENSFDKTMGYIEMGARSSDAKVVFGGQGDKREGYYIQPTVIETSNPRHTLMEEEIFAPVLTIHPYDDAKLAETVQLVDSTSPYALTGAIFARDRKAVRELSTALRHAAGNFYINDKPTGAVVGQQPFGGARASGTNDKAGSAANLMRWVNMRSIKENFVPPTDFPYAHQGEE